MKTPIKSGLTVNEIVSKIRSFCFYQDRCFKELEVKMKEFHLIDEIKEKIIIQVIDEKWVDEERFAKSFVRGKHNYKSWGKNRIVQELKFREISKKNIEIALIEIEVNYINNFNLIAEKTWISIQEKKGQKKNKKFVDYLLRKGFETNLIFEKLKELDV